MKRLLEMMDDKQAGKRLLVKCATYVALPLDKSAFLAAKPFSTIVSKKHKVKQFLECCCGYLHPKQSRVRQCSHP